MRLLNTSTGRLQWVETPHEHRYAALSHVWSKPGDPRYSPECSFQDIIHLQDTYPNNILPLLPAKIRRFCEVARQDGFDFAWVDSCCIDNTCSSEVSESINSMFSWYRHSEACYVFLHDVSEHSDSPSFQRQFETCKWFTRGWTLQELLAPRTVIFLSSDWTFIGSKHTLVAPIERVTGIDTSVILLDRSLHEVPVARRMSWASLRETTRVEDQAYCLLGIFGVHIPTKYGEGSHAFMRLQEEILRRIPDQSVFAWGLVQRDTDSLRRATTPFRSTYPHPSSAPHEPPRALLKPLVPFMPSDPHPRRASPAATLPPFPYTAHEPLSPLSDFRVSTGPSYPSFPDEKSILDDVPHLCEVGTGWTRASRRSPCCLWRIARTLAKSFSRAVSTVLSVTPPTKATHTSPINIRIRHEDLLASSPKAFSNNSSRIIPLRHDIPSLRVGISPEEMHPDFVNSLPEPHIRLPLAATSEADVPAHERPIVLLLACEDEQKRTLALILSPAASDSTSDCFDAKFHKNRSHSSHNPTTRRMVHLSREQLEECRRCGVFRMAAVTMGE